MKQNLELPESFEKYRAVLQETLKECVHIHTEKASTGTFDSKFGGSPYFPKEETYPVDEKDKPMRLLAQINFEQVPQLKNYPETGILQFYLSPFDGYFGCSFGRSIEQKNYRVIFFDKIERDEAKLLSDFSFTRTEEGLFPLKGEGKLTFTKGTQIITANDFRFEPLLGLEDKYELEEDLEEYFEMFDSFSHVIGGYPDFVQDDPRENRHPEHTELLLQIDSDNTVDIMWGDCGMANFFISLEDLKKKDFSKVLYNWDCS
ncbi:LAQU0S03e06018g1_1 [Lachancea quebecensis]|uniref:LAQU0S03e06018g1_1 n=1 Tax=Lachancea quebecensis TaxID=1654605 RepID=A0A0N7ML86_9SACH|nr:LAQU0S03e06018g1_1 [Lachancea quebecensis]